MKSDKKELYALILDVLPMTGGDPRRPQFKKEQLVQAVGDSNIVFDTNSGGVALACSLSKVPFVAVKVVERYIDKNSDVKTYLEAMKEYVNVGKALVTCIGDIGRNEIITEGK